MQILRSKAVRQSLFPPTTLGEAISRLEFVQADPIREPARAEDLILRHRVSGYLKGHLHDTYPLLDIEEGGLFAYGFLSRRLWRLAHPPNRVGLSAIEQRVLAVVRERGETHPASLRALLGSERAVNDWGGYSRVTKLALESLHRRGLVRVVRRVNQIRIYDVALPSGPSPAASTRLRELVLAAFRILAPLPESSLLEIIARIRRAVPGLRSCRYDLADVVSEGEVEWGRFDGVRYFWCAPDGPEPEPPNEVRFLAPFDPIVWDRRRFEHLWGWKYRFEAYTPPKRRIRGRYAMPLLWRELVVGWANARFVGTRLDVEVELVENRKIGGKFGEQLEKEIQRLKTFLGGDEL